MKNNDELQYMPISGRVRYTDDNFKTTNVKNHGNSKGQVRWNAKKFVTNMILTGGACVLIAGGVHAFKNMSTPPKEPIAVEQNIDDESVVVTPVEQTVRVVVDYKVKTGDTLDGIIYKYTKDASEKDYYKNYVTYYNDIENDMIRAGQVITLVGVPEEYKDELNTGYDANYDMNDEISVELNGAVQEMLEEVGPDYSTGSLVDTVVRELEVYNNTTNQKTRSYLAKTMLKQIENVKEYGMPDVEPRAKGR